MTAATARRTHPVLVLFAAGCIAFMLWALFYGSHAFSSGPHTPRPPTNTKNVRPATPAVTRR